MRLDEKQKSENMKNFVDQKKDLAMLQVPAIIISLYIIMRKNQIFANVLDPAVQNNVAANEKI